MTNSTETAAPELKRSLKLRDLVLFNVVAVLGLRHLATSSKAGPMSLALWGLAVIFFFIPQGLAVVELSSRFPKEGGVYFWTKRAFGEGHGFLCGWCYWINNVLYYPNLLISTAVIATFAVGKENAGLDKNWHYLIACTLITLWIVVLVNIVGMGTGKWLQNLGGIGTYVPGLVLIVAGLAYLVHHPSATQITMQNIKPNFKDMGALNLWATIAFALAGLELSATMGDEVQNPRKNLPRAIYVAAPLIALLYILGTASMLWLIPNKDIDIVSGFLQGIKFGTSGYSWLWWLGPACAAAYTIGNLGGVGAWLTGPARVAFVIGLDKYFPSAFGKIHPKWGTPYVAIIVQASLATIFLFISTIGAGTKVEEVYLILLDTQVLIYFIPYIYLFIVFMVHRKRASEESSEIVKAPGGVIGAAFVGLSGLAITIFAIVLATIPPADADPLLFRVKVLGGAGGFILVGGLIYWIAQFKAKRAA
ncbi:MAG TPA: APC family permease [Blastocatellia bacterium]|nr:APC family permease [Blastocatellia bacterium]